jgi:hypothetical protein
VVQPVSHTNLLHDFLLKVMSTGLLHGIHVVFAVDGLWVVYLSHQYTIEFVPLVLKSLCELLHCV